VDREAAFYEFFQTHQLDSLTEAELLRCLHALANARGDQGTPVLGVLAHEPERLRVIHKLTGGNPRVLALVYQILERQESDTVFSDLEVLLDQVTPFYKARVEELNTDLQRAIFDAIALHWDPITSSKLSKDTGVEITTISSQLNRFRNQGLVEEVATSGSRSGYQLLERFFNIWYLMRHGTRRARQKVQWLTAFLSSFYSAEELREFEKNKREEAKWSPLYVEALAAAIDRCESDPASRVAVHSFNGGHMAKDSHIASQSLRSLRARAKRRPDDARAWGLLALKLMELDKDQEAEAAVRRAIEIAPQLPVAWATLARLLADGSRQREAEQAFQKAVDLEPSEDKFWVSWASTLHAQKRFDEAESVCRRGLAVNEKGKGLWVELGHLLHYHQNQPAAAEEAYRSAIEIDPLSSGLWVALGDLLSRSPTRYDEAERAYRTAIDVDSRDALAWSSLGRVLGFLGRDEEADKAHRSATGLAPNEGQVWYEFGNFLVHVKRFDEAERAYRRATELDPYVPSGWRNLSNLLHYLHRFPEAEEVCRQAIEKVEDGDIWFNLAELLHHHLDRPSEAEEACRRAIEIDPKDRRYWAALGALQGDLGRYDKAEEAYRQALDLEPQDAVTLNMFGDLLQELRRYEDAEVAYRRAIELDPDKAIFRYDLLWILIARGRLTEASELRTQLSDIDFTRVSIIDSALEISRDNFGEMTAKLDKVLLEADGSTLGNFGLLIRLFRLIERLGYGERFIDWLKVNGHDLRYAPLFAAFVASIRGERALLDFNPEARGPAKELFRRIAAGIEPHAAKKVSQRRARPRKIRHRAT
jgi:tetratricopeptide (TPR) repeat protein